MNFIQIMRIILWAVEVLLSLGLIKIKDAPKVTKALIDKAMKENTA